MYFFHIEKCAGTSLRHTIFDAFKGRYTEDELHIPGLTRASEQSIRAYAGLGPESMRYFETVKVIADHSNPGELAALLGVPVEVKFGITALRHPVDRALSQLHYFSPGVTSLHDLPDARLERFVRRAGNWQTTRLSNGSGSVADALAALRDMDSIILAEQYRTSIELLNRVSPFDAVFTDSARQNVTEGDRGDYRSLYSEDFKRSLEQYCANDMKLYAEGRRIFEEMCEREGI